MLDEGRAPRGSVIVIGAACRGPDNRDGITAILEEKDKTAADI